MLDFLSDPGNWILTALTQLLYFLESCCYTLLDLAQLMFRLVAGLDTYSLAGSEIEGEAIGGIQLGGSGDIFYQIIRRTFIVGDDSYSVIAIAFWSLVILSCILLFITTIAAMIKSEVAVGKDGKLDNSKGKIIGSAIKALLYFVIVPISCYFGIWLGNVMLFVIDEATSPQATSIISIDEGARQNLDAGETGSYNYYIFWGDARNTTYTSISGLVNKICLYSGNRIRNDDAFYHMIVSDVTQTNPPGNPEDPNPDDGETQPITPIEGATYNFGIITQDTPEAAAAVVDDLFMFNAKLRTPQVLNSYDYLSAYGNASGSTVEYFDRSNISLVSYFYDLKSYNHILAILFIFTGGKVLLTLSFAAMHRIIMLLAMMFAEPITLSFMPLDKGEAFGKWRKSFISHVISLYVLVLVVNVFYIIAPIFQTFTFFSTTLSSLAWADMVVQAAFIIASLMAIQSFEKMFSGFLGGESIMESGGKTMEGLTNSAKTLVGLGMGTAHIGMHAVGLAGDVVSGVGHLGAAGIKSKLAKHNMRKDESMESSYRQKMKNVEGRANITDDQIDRNAREDALKAVRMNASNDYQAYQDNTTRDAYSEYKKAGGSWSQDEWQQNTGAGTYADAWSSGMSMHDYFDKYHPESAGNDDAYGKWLSEGQQSMIEGGLATDAGTGFMVNGSLSTAGSATRNTLNHFGGMSEEEYVNKQLKSAKDSIDNTDINSEIYQSYKKGVDDAVKDRLAAREMYDDFKKEVDFYHDKKLKRAEGVQKSLKLFKEKSYERGKQHVKGALSTLGGMTGKK